MNPQYPRVAFRARHRCEYCRAPEAMFNFPFEVEHIVPISQSGEDHEANYALSCRSCNLFKGVQVQAVDPVTKMTVGLFNPRQDLWDQHFEINMETDEITGKTPAGRGTVACLNMNSEAQIAARRQWIRLGLFP